MKKLIYFFALLFLSVQGISQTRITAPLVRNSPSDTSYYLLADSLLSGGLMVFTNTTTRDALPFANRKVGMIAVVDTFLYQLRGGITNSNWYQLVFSGGGSGGSTDTTKVKLPCYVLTKEVSGSAYDSLICPIDSLIAATLSDSLLLKLNISDTAAMLAAYVDTGSIVKFLFTSLKDGDLLKYDSANSRFINFELTGTGSVTYDIGTGVINGTGGAGGGAAIGDTVTSATAGSIFYAGTGGKLQQSNSTFFYDSTNNKLSIGTTTGNSAYVLDIVKNLNSGQRISIVNSNAGTAAAAMVQVGNGTSLFQTGVLGTGYTTSGLNVPGTAFFQSNNGSRLLFKAIDGGTFSNPPIIFATQTAGVDSERWRIDFSSGGFTNTGGTGSAYINLKAGTTTMAPFKFTPGVVTTTALSGTLETNSANKLAYTDGSTTRGFVQVNKTSGTSQTSNIATLVAGTVTVNTTEALTASNIQLTTKTPGGTPGFLSYSIVDGVSFTITSSSATDTSTVGWVIIN